MTEQRTITVMAYRTPEGKPTCATDFDEGKKAQQEAEVAERRRRDKLTGDIRDALWSVPEDVLIRALAVLRGEQ